MACHKGGVAWITLCFWISFGLMLTAVLMTDWSMMDVNVSGSGSLTVGRLAPFLPCALIANVASASTMTHYDCKYLALFPDSWKGAVAFPEVFVASSSFPPDWLKGSSKNSTSAVSTSFQPNFNCGQYSTTGPSGCQQPEAALLAIRICVILFLVLQFIGSLLSTFVLCTKCASFRIAKFICYLAETFQVVIVILWYVEHQWYDAMAQTMNQYVNSSTTSTSYSVRLTISWFLAIGSCVFTFIASLIMCVTVYPKPPAPYQPEPNVAALTASAPYLGDYQQQP